MRSQTVLYTKGILRGTNSFTTFLFLQVVQYMIDNWYQSPEQNGLYFFTFMFIDCSKPVLLWCLYRKLVLLIFILSGSAYCTTIIRSCQEETDMRISVSDHHDLGSILLYVLHFQKHFMYYKIIVHIECLIVADEKIVKSFYILYKCVL